MVNEFTSYEAFKAEYVKTFKAIFRYTPNQIGSSVYTEKLAELSDAYPEWAERAENEGE